MAKMEIDDKIYQEAIEVLRIKLRNTSAKMAFVENHSHQPEWYLHGMMRGLEIGYAIIKDLQYNKIYPGFKEEERTLEDWEKARQEIIEKLGGCKSNDES